MNRKSVGLVMGISLFMFIVAAFPGSDADARAGGGRSFGSRGSRSYSPPSKPAQPAQGATSNRQATPPQATAPQPAGGFMRGMGGGLLGGIAGGLLGGMLFSSIAGASGGMGGIGGSGIGLFEIILVAGIGYFIYRMVQSKRTEANNSAYPSAHGAANEPYQSTQFAPGINTLDQGLSHVRQMDTSFDENRFNENVTDIFFKIQGAWMNRNISSVQPLLTDETRKAIQADVDGLLRDRKTNHLENIAVRKVEIFEAWQEEGNDFITVLFTANLLDYTTDDSTGAIVAGSKTEPVKFEEHWTFTRNVGNNPWKLSAINQVAGQGVAANSPFVF
ncbi:MAG: Tim44 domain-containing protein [Nitrospinae bacterium]|nr:Tim44 domain-containing protein [Nitrospinota bacterium]